MVAQMLKEEARLQEWEIRRKQLSKLEGALYTNIPSSSCNDTSCSCHAYPSGWSLNHVLSCPLNYQTDPMRVKPPIEVVWN